MANQITDRQIAYIEKLSAQRWQDAVAQDMGCLPSAALKRAAKADGTRTIDRLTSHLSVDKAAAATRLEDGLRRLYLGRRHNDQIQREA